MSGAEQAGVALAPKNLKANGHHQNMNPHHQEYRSFLLRMWRDSADGEWRSSLQDTITSKTYFFAGLDALATFLGEPMDEETPEPGLAPSLGRRLRVSMPKAAALIEKENRNAR